MWSSGAAALQRPKRSAPLTGRPLDRSVSETAANRCHFLNATLATECSEHRRVEAGTTLQTFAMQQNAYGVVFRSTAQRRESYPEDSTGLGFPSAVVKAFAMD